MALWLAFFFPILNYPFLSQYQLAHTHAHIRAHTCVCVISLCISPSMGVHMNIYDYIYTHEYMRLTIFILIPSNLSPHPHTYFMCHSVKDFSVICVKWKYPHQFHQSICMPRVGLVTAVTPDRPVNFMVLICIMLRYFFFRLILVWKVDPFKSPM